MFVCLFWYFWVGVCFFFWLKKGGEKEGKEKNLINPRDRKWEFIPPIFVTWKKRSLERKLVQEKEREASSEKKKKNQEGLP